MTIPFRRLAALLVLAAHPAALLAQDNRAGDVRKVTDPAGREVSYPTPLAEVMSATAVARAVTKDAPVASGEAVLTKGALTHVRMTPGQPEAVLFANTLVRFDAVNQWLLRSGAAFIVNRRGKLAVVVEGLETLFVGSEVYVEKTAAGLLAYVVEGSVRVGATGVALGPGQAARVAPGGAAQRTELSSADRARVVRQIELARGVMGAPPVASGGGGGGGVAVGVVLGLGAAGAGVYLLTKDDARSPRSPTSCRCRTGGAVCGFDARGVRIVRVMNAGEGPAAASSTRVASAAGRDVMLPTPALAAGETTVLARAHRTRVHVPGELTVDAGGAVAESNEGNNDLREVCADRPASASRGPTGRAGMAGMSPMNLDLDTLRTLATAEELRGYGRAAEAPGPDAVRRQPADEASPGRRGRAPLPQERARHSTHRGGRAGAALRPAHAGAERRAARHRARRTRMPAACGSA